MKNVIFFIAFIFLILIYFFINKEEVIGDKVLLGQSCALSGPAKQLGQRMSKGASAYFLYVNSQGGIHGRTVHLETMDDFYEPEYAKKNTLHLITQKNIFALFGEVGTPTSKVALPIAKEYNIPFLFPFTGAEFLRNPAESLIINLRNSYYAETDALVQFLAAKKKVKRIAVFYQNDSYGKAGLQGVKLATKKLGLEIVAQGRYRRNTLSYRNAFYNIKASNPDAIIMIGAYKPVSQFIKLAKKEGMQDTLFCNISFVGSDALVKELDGKTQNVIISQVVPLAWDASSNASIKEYQEIFSYYFPGEAYDFISLEGFLSAKLVVKALHKAGKELTREGFMKSFEQLSPNSLEGLSISLSNQDREALDRVYITDFYEGKFRLLEEVVVQ